VSERRRRWLVVGLVLALWLLLSVASYFMLTLPRENRFDFFHCWVGTRAVLARETPYSQDVVQRIHEGMFGEWHGGAEYIQQRFAYPAFITWLLLPFWLLPFPVAVSLWCGLQLLILLAIPLLLMSLLKWRPRPLALAAMLFCSVFLYRYPLTAYVLGQFTPFAAVCLVVAWWGLVRGHPVLAVLALLGALVRPEVASLPLLALLIAAWRLGRRNVLVAWAASAAGLWLVTRLWIGPWVSGFLGGMGQYAGTSFLRWPPMATGSVWVAMPVVLLTLVWVVWMWLQLHREPAESRMPYELSVAILAALLLLPQTNSYTLVVSLVPVWVVLWAGSRHRGTWIPVLIVLVLPWAFFFTGDLLPAGLEQLAIPVALSVLLTLRLQSRVV
jgi:hypothetical protein